MEKLTCLLLILTLVLGFSSFSASAEEPVTLTLSGWGDAQEKAVVESVLAEFTKDTGINVEFLFIPTDYMTKLTTMAAAGELPDCGYMAESNTVEWANNGMLADLSSMLDREDNAAKLDSNKFIDKDGKVVGVSMANEAVIMYYNPTYFDQMGVEHPPAKGEDAWTWEEFVEVCRKLTVDANGKHPGEEGFDPTNIKSYGVKIGKASYIYEALLRSNGGGIFTEDYSDIALDRPESIEVFQALADLITVEHVSPSPESAAHSMNMASCFLSNSVAMVIEGQWSVMSMAIAAEEDGITFDVGVLPYFDTPVTGNTGAPVVVFASTKHPEEAMELVNYLTSAQYVMAFINNGLWQPVLEEWYTNEELIDQWIVEGVHPAHYREAVIDYTMQYMQPTSFFRVGCFSQIENLFLPALDTAILGTSSAQESIDSVIKECRKVYSEYIASIS